MQVQSLLLIPHQEAGWPQEEESTAMKPDDITPEKVTITLSINGGWSTAVCRELDASGVGVSPTDALESISRSIESVLREKREIFHEQNS